jgi:Tfp pilus assembly protein PilF
MRRRLNVKMLLALVGGAALSGLALHLLHGYQVKKQAGSLLEQADRAEKKSQHRLAIDYLRRYLAFKPVDTGALARFGRLLARADVAVSEKDGLFALAILESVLRRDPTRDDERRLLIELGLRLRNHKDVQYHTESLLGLKNGEDAGKHLAGVLKEDPRKGVLVGRLAMCHEAQKHYRQARTFYELAVRHAPDEVTNYVGLSSLLREHTDKVLRTGKDARKRETPAALHRHADQLLDDLVQANPGNARSYLARAQYRRRYSLAAGREATSAAIDSDLREALKRGGGAEVLLALAGLAADQDHPEMAREVLLRARKTHTQDWRVYRALARLERGLNRFDEALRHLREGLRELPDRIELLLEHADLLAVLGSSEARPAIDRLKSAGVPAAELAVLSARLLTRERKWADALQLLVPAHAQLLGREDRERSAFLAEEQCNLLLAQCYEGLGDPFRAQNAYLRLLAGNPRSVEAHLGVARTHEALGQGREAETHYRQIANLRNGRGALVEVARLVLQRNLRKDDPDWDEVDDALAMAEGLQPRPPAVALLRAEALARQAELESDRSKKSTLLEEARAVLVVNLLGAMPVRAGLLRPEMLLLAALPQPRSLAVLWIGLSAHEERAGRLGPALHLLDEAERCFGDLPEVRQARMRYWARRPGPEAVQALAGLERGLGKFPPEERRLLRTTLALACANVGQADRAGQLWQSLAKDHPEDWSVRLVLFNQALEKNDGRAMDVLLEELRQIEKADGVLWRDATVRRLLAQTARGDDSVLPRARQLTAEIAARWPGWLGVTQFEAQIEDLAGSPDRALPKYLTAIDRGAASTQTVWRAMEILNAQQRYREASALRAKLPPGPFAAGLEQAAALASFQANNDAEALARAERAASQAPQDYRPHLLLGQIYWRTRQMDKALASLRKARDLSDRTPETWMTLIAFLWASEKKDQARAELAGAEKKLTDVRGKVVLAQCFEIVGDNDRAGKLYANPQLAGSSDLLVRRGVAGHFLRGGNATVARKHLNYLVKAAGTKDPSTAVWARGMLAILAALGGDYAETQEALASLNQSAARDAAAGIDGRRAQAAILAKRGNRSDRLKAVALLQALLVEGRDQPPDRLLLAQLHEANNDWPKARRQLAALLKMSGGATPANLVAYVSALLRHGELEEAERALRQLEKLPSTTGTLALASLQAQLLHRQGKAPEAVALLIRHATKRGQAFGQVALVLEELKEHKAAERMYQKHQEQSPNPAALLAYAAFLGRQKRYDEALDVCERAWVKAPADAVANACLGLLEGARDNLAVQGRVDRQFRAALKKDPRSVLLRLSLANLRVVQRDYPDAERIYAELIRDNPGNVLARNNLAWLLACQKKRIPEALVLMAEAIARAGPQATLLDTQALVLLEAGRAKEAVKILEGLVLELPNKTGFRFHLARAHAADGNRQEARRAALQALRLGLKESTLHTLERPACARLLQGLGLPSNALARE